jgi:hypothetical protein
MKGGRFQLLRDIHVAAQRGKDLIDSMMAIWITHYCVRILYLRRFFCVAKIYPLPFSNIQIFDIFKIIFLDFWIFKFFFFLNFKIILTSYKGRNRKGRKSSNVINDNIWRQTQLLDSWFVTQFTGNWAPGSKKFKFGGLNPRWKETAHAVYIRQPPNADATPFQ